MELILFRSMRLVLTLLLFRNVFGMVPDAPTERKLLFVLKIALYLSTK